MKGSFSSSRWHVAAGRSSAVAVSATTAPGEPLLEPSQRRVFGRNRGPTGETQWASADGEQAEGQLRQPIQKLCAAANVRGNINQLDPPRRMAAKFWTISRLRRS